MEKKQNSIEWLEQQLNVILKQGNIEIENVIWQQAKAMHKEQIINAYEQGEEDAYWHPEIGYSRKYKDSEQYYNETFGGQDNE